MISTSSPSSTLIFIPPDCSFMKSLMIFFKIVDNLSISFSGTINSNKKVIYDKITETASLFKMFNFIKTSCNCV